MTEEQIRVSVEEKPVSGVCEQPWIKRRKRSSADARCGRRRFLKEYVKHIVMESAQRALDGGVDLADKTWLTIENGKVQSMDLRRMSKTSPA